MLGLTYAPCMDTYTNTKKGHVTLLKSYSFCSNTLGKGKVAFHVNCAVFSGKCSFTTITQPQVPLTPRNHNSYPATTENTTHTRNHITYNLHLALISFSHCNCGALFLLSSFLIHPMHSHVLMTEKVLLLCLLWYIHELHMYKRDQRNIVEQNMAIEVLVHIDTRIRACMKLLVLEHMLIVLS